MFHCQQLPASQFLLHFEDISVVANMNARGRAQAKMLKAEGHELVSAPKSAEQCYLTSYTDKFPCITGASRRDALCVHLIFWQVWSILCHTRSVHYRIKMIKYCKHKIWIALSGVINILTLLHIKLRQGLQLRSLWSTSLTLSQQPLASRHDSCAQHGKLH